MLERSGSAIPLAPPGPAGRTIPVGSINSHVPIVSRTYSSVVSVGSVNSPWHTVRCVFRSSSDDGFAYEERLTLWLADSMDQAITLGQGEAAECASAVENEYIGLAQAYQLPELPASGVEVFSLIRDSELAAGEYLNQFFDTGREFQID
jgi:hypothetical protein